uniref:2-C-methyl-D-erythritol 2,4-cyclodiphosphate synthase n=1 Tax=Phaseolus vulgaris TaxID=3885 RepID=T2DN59_PHAVU|nr:2-C-methyl-D-erythritol 2 4-cyclodiphosphate synthase [Phaseolus vulgaris]
MAMAATSSAASSILLPFTTNPKTSHLFASFPCKNNTLLPSLRLRHISASTSASATPTPSIQVDKSPVSAAPSKVLPFRIGHGFDLHRLEPGYPLIIGGINIPQEKGCETHAKGNVLLHCVVGSILGAKGLREVGQIFPDNDPKWKGGASSVFIHKSVEREHEAGYEIGNLGRALIGERPKLSPHRATIKTKVSALLGVDSGGGNIKAKTQEKVGSLGENRRVATHAVVVIMRKKKTV